MDNKKLKVSMRPNEHHGCQGQYPSWETASAGTRWVDWCYGCGRTFYQDTGEEAHLWDREASVNADI